MLKSRLGHSVWESFVSRFSGSRRLARKARRSLRVGSDANRTGETLEQRIVPAGTSPVNVSFSAGTLTLLSNTGAVNETVSVKAGTAFTDVLVNGKFSTRLNGVTNSTISTINFNGGGGTADSLSVSGISTALTVGLTGVEKLGLNTGDTTVTSNAGFALLTSNVAGPLTLTATTGDVTQSGAVNVSGTTTVTATVGNINLNNTSNAFGTLVLSGANVTIKESGPTDFGTTGATGTFTVTSTGAITDSGVVTVGGATSVTSNGNSVTLDGTGAGSSFGGTLTLKGTDVLIIDVDGDTALGAVTAAGNLTVTSTTGAVTHPSGNITVGGLANITAEATNNITLTAGSNNFGSLQLSGVNVSITEKSATNLFTTGATGSLTIVSSGAITDTGVVTVGTTTSLTAAGNAIRLDTSTSTYAGTVTFVKGTDIALTDNDGATDIGASTATGSLSITTTPVGATAGVTQSGALSVAGRLTVTATGLNINLPTATNKFGSVSVFGKAVTLKEGDATDLFTSTITGALTLTSLGNVTDSGVITQSGGSTSITATGKSITLDTPESTFTGGSLSFTGFNVAVTDNDGTTSLGATTATGNYTVTSTGAGTGVTQTATTLNVTGRLTVTANDVASKDIVLTSATNKAGSVSLFGDDVSFIEADATNLYTTTAASTFTLISGGDVTDSGDVTVGGVTDINATAANNITLDSALSTYTGNVKLNGKDVSIFNDTATNFGTTTAAGLLNVKSNGAIDDIGVVSVTTKATFNALGNNVTLDNTADVFTGAISLFGVDVTLTPTAGSTNVSLGTSKATGTLTVTANGNITQVGTVKADGVTTLTTTNTATQDITLTAGLNSFGQLILNANDATINEFGETDLGASTLTGDLVVTSSGGITDSGILAVTGVADLTAQDGDILLNSAASAFGSLDLLGNNIDVTEAGNTQIDAVDTHGNFALTSTGDVTQTGAITADGDASVTTLATKDITLTDANNFGTFQFSGQDVSFNENSNTDLEASTAAGVLTITSLGNITGNGAVTSVSDTDLKAGAAGDQSIDLTQAGTHFGDMKLQGSTVTILDGTGGTNLLTGTTITGAFTLTSVGGDVTQDPGTVIVQGLLTVTATANDILLSEATNQFQSLSLFGDDADIEDSIGDIILVTSNLTGDLTLSAVGNVTDSDLSVITIAGVTKITTTGGNIILDEADSTYATVVLVGTDIELNSFSSIQLGNGAGENINAGGTLTIRTFNGGDIDQSAGSVITAPITCADAISRSEMSDCTLLRKSE